MTDTRRLLANLSEYEQALIRQMETLRSHHEPLRLAWQQLHEVYAGSAAEHFAEAWRRADDGFVHYLEDGIAVQEQLRRGIESLRILDTASHNRVDDE